MKGDSQAGLGSHDAQLIAEMVMANGDALAALMQRYGKLVYRVASDILRDAAEAEDVTQEIFFEVYRRARLYDPAKGTVKTWLLYYAYHRSLRRRNTLRRRPAYRGEPLESVETLAPLALRGMALQEQHWLIRAGLSRLSEPQRATLELTCFPQLTLSEIAARLRIPYGCTRHHYYRGVARLRNWWQEAERAH